MATLIVNTTDDFSADALSGIDLIAFTNLAGPATATFAASQFDGVTILDDVELGGSAEINSIVVAGGSLARDASGMRIVALLPAFRLSAAPVASFSLRS